MALAETQHHQVLGLVIEPVERLEAQAADRVHRVGGQRRPGHHVRQQRQRSPKAVADQRGGEPQVVRQHLARPLHAQAVERVAVLAAVEPARPAEDQLAQHRGQAIAVGRVCGRPDRQQPVQGDGGDAGDRLHDQCRPAVELSGDDPAHDGSGAGGDPGS
jgi:hypothetical protein